MTPKNKTKEVLCPLHLPSLAWGAASLDTAVSLGWMRFLLLSVQEYFAPRTQVADGGMALCLYVCLCPDCFQCLLDAVIR